MAFQRCGARCGDDEASTCALPLGHAGPHAAAPTEAACDHRDEQGASLLIFFHDGSRCSRCGAFV